MKILITGSNGYLGSYLVRHLKDHQITELPCRLEEDIEPYFKGQDLVIHCASKLSIHTPEEIYRVNVLGTEKVALLCLKYNCKLINISSSGVHDKDSVYGRSKAEAEKIVEKYVVGGLEAITIRPTQIYNESILYFFRAGKWCSLREVARVIKGLLYDSFEYRIIEVGKEHNRNFISKMCFRIIRKIQKTYDSLSTKKEGYIWGYPVSDYVNDIPSSLMDENGLIDGHKPEDLIKYLHKK